LRGDQKEEKPQMRERERERESAASFLFVSMNQFNGKTKKRGKRQALWASLLKNSKPYNLIFIN